MPFYKPLKKLSPSDRIRAVKGLQSLRRQLDEVNFPKKQMTTSLILGTWNIRNFDDDRFNYGPRMDESLFYIAEIISRFDIIAVQEICVDLEPLQRLMRILGSDYEYIFTDVTHSSLGGNKERLGFIYDKSKVNFQGIAGEIVLPDKQLINDGESRGRQFARTPFGAEFQSGWFKFNFSTVHIYFGSNDKNSPLNKRRVEEIQAVAKYLKTEAARSEQNQILVGDFNISERGSNEFNALENEKFKTVKNRLGSNRDQTKFYDQISFLTKKNGLELLEPDRDDRVIQYFDSVFRDDDFDTYLPVMRKMIGDKLERSEELLEKETRKTYRQKLEKEIAAYNEWLKPEADMKAYYYEWRTFQMSDHLPLWVEIKIDFSEQYLEHLRTM